MSRTLLLLLTLVTLAGCDQSATNARVVELVLSEPADAQPLPVRVVDTTGNLVGVSDERPAIVLDFSGRGAVVNPPGKENVLSLQWIGGACDAGVTLLVRLGGEGRLRLELTTGTRGEACPDVGIHRTVNLMFARPVADDEVRLEFIDA
jgi:hypothetical protein